MSHNSYQSPKPSGGVDVTVTVNAMGSAGTVSEWYSPDWCCGGGCRFCCGSYWCTYCNLARQYNMVKYNRPEMHMMMCLFPLLADLLLCSGIGLCVETMLVRMAIMERYNIYSDREPGTEAPDYRDWSCQDMCGVCCMAWCCTVCAACQQHDELTLRGDYPGDTCACCDYRPGDEDMV